MAKHDTCPYCGQPLLNAETVERLHRNEDRHEAELRQSLEKTMRRDVESEIRDKVERDRGAQQLKLQRMIDQLQAHNDELQRELDGFRAPDLGEIDEAWMFEHLSSTFHREGDEIRREGKGGDIVHVVNCSDGAQMHPAGLILYEIKNTKTWLNKYIDQIKNDGMTRNTPYLMLVSRKLPGSEDGMCVKDGVVIADQAHALHLARVLRRMVIETYRAGVAGADHQVKTARLYEYLNSEEFRAEIGAVVATGHELREILDTERRSHERTWSRREHVYAELERRSISIDERIHNIIRAEPPISTNGRKHIKAAAYAP